MELDLTTNANVVFLYPLSLVQSVANGESSFMSQAPQNQTQPGGTTQTQPTQNRRMSILTRTSSVETGSSSSSIGSPSNPYVNMDEYGSKFKCPTETLLVTVHLTVPPKVSPPKTIHSLILTLTTIESISFPKGRYEQNQPLSKKIVVEEAAGTVLASGGIYRWEVAVPIPRKTPPYERTRHASVRQRVSARVTFSGLLSRALSVDKPLAFVAVPTLDSTEPLTWSRTHTASTGHLGPFFISLRTQHLTIGGFLRAALVLSSPRPDLELVSFTAKLVQQVSLKSRDLPNFREAALPTEVEFLRATGEELKVNEKKAIEGSWLVRLPNCNRIRPSTIAGSDAAVHVNSNVEVHLSFLDKPFSFEKVSPNELDASGRRLYHYRVSWFIVLPSCTLRWRSFLLPAYSMLDRDPVPATSREFCGDERGTSMKFCTCGEDIESLLSYECEAESNLLTSALMQEDIHRFQQLAARHIHTEQPISGGTSFGSESLEGQVLEETDVERKDRLLREKETNEYSAVEDGVGEIILFQDFGSRGVGAVMPCKA